MPSLELKNIQTKISYVLAFLCIILMIVDLYLIFWVAPLDVVLGNIQKIFYIHVPIAAMAFLGFFLVFVFSIIYLVKRSDHWDRLAYASGEVGVVFVSVTLITGVVWARPVWGVWWTWEPRLTTTLILWLIYVAYLMVRSYAPNRSQGSLYAAAIGIIGFIDVPIVYYSVQWWRSIHPSAVVGPFAESGALEPIMTKILLVSLVAFAALFLLLLNQRVSVKKQEDLLQKTLELSNK